MKKIFLLATLLPLISCNNNSTNTKVICTIDAPYTVVSNLETSYAVNSEVTIQFTPKTYFALPTKDQISVEYGDQDFTYSEDTGTLKLKLTTNTLISVDASLKSGKRVNAREVETWINFHTPEGEEEKVFKSISMNWGFNSSDKPQTVTKAHINDFFVKTLLFEEAPNLLTNLTGSFIHTNSGDEAIPIGDDFISNFFTISMLRDATCRCSIDDNQAIIFCETCRLWSDDEEELIPSYGNAIVYFDNNAMIKKFCVMFDNFIYPFVIESPLTGTLEFNYAY
ncbi:MAG: hypothetical protein MJ214_03270 [Bacilli bacterium]|nr:hypothetical protein [Bacilli bacterium]